MLVGRSLGLRLAPLSESVSKRATNGPPPARSGRPPAGAQPGPSCGRRRPGNDRPADHAQIASRWLTLNEGRAGPSARSTPADDAGRGGGRHGADARGVAWSLRKQLPSVVGGADDHGAPRKELALSNLSWRSAFSAKCVLFIAGDCLSALALAPPVRAATRTRGWRARISVGCFDSGSSPDPSSVGQGQVQVQLERVTGRPT